MDYHFNMSKKTIYVYQDIDDTGTIIGVTDNKSDGELLINSYYGEHIVLENRIVEDSGVEFYRRIEAEGIVCSVICKSFDLNSI